MSDYSAGVGAEEVMKQTYSLFCSREDVRVLGEFNFEEVHAELINGDSHPKTRPTMAYRGVKIIELKNGRAYALSVGRISMRGVPSEYSTDIIAIELNGDRNSLTKEKLEELVAKGNVDFENSVVCALANGKLIANGKRFGNKMKDILSKHIFNGCIATPEVYSRVALDYYLPRDSSVGLVRPRMYSPRFSRELAASIEGVLKGN